MVSVAIVKIRLALRAADRGAGSVGWIVEASPRISFPKRIIGYSLEKYDDGVNLISLAGYRLYGVGGTCLSYRAGTGACPYGGGIGRIFLDADA